MESSNHKDDITELLIKAKKGDSCAFLELQNKCKPMIKGVALNYFLKGGEDADLLQEGYIGFWEAIKYYDKNKNCSFKHFAKLCVKRNIISAIISSNRKKHKPLNSYQSFTTDSSEASVGFSFLDRYKDCSVRDPLETCIYHEKLDEINQIMEKYLSNFERKVLKLYLRGLTYIEIGEILQKDKKSIDNALQRGKKKVMGRIEI